MLRPVIGVTALLLLLPSCKKEQVKAYTVSLRATCYDCVMQYAAGPDRGRYDTLYGGIEGADTLRETGDYSLTMREGEDLFFRACRLTPDSGRFGPIDLEVAGQAQPFAVSVEREADCAVINRAVQFR
ncbi:MAG TPA: hypothetical protein PLL57_01420 [Flavobacteriales bacterium]|nr:hypothetical protein [Flavobacteriales bacterium]